MRKLATTVCISLSLDGFFQKGDVVEELLTGSPELFLESRCSRLQCDCPG